MNLNVVDVPDPEGGFVAWLAEMPSVQTQGETLAETKENLRDALQLSLEYLREKSAKMETSNSLREPFDVVVK
jgi:predicted RNase H-like HicB family nuclease